MKNTISFICLSFIFISCSSNSVNQAQLIEGKVNNNSGYIGGANPPQEILDGLAIYHPSANQTFYVRNAINYAPFMPILTSFTTNPLGNYTLNLPSGNYAVICQEKYNFEQNPLATASCDYLQQPDFILNIVPSQQVYISEYTQSANYCLGYPQ